MTVGEVDARALADALEDLTGAPRRDSRTGPPRDHPQGCRIQVSLGAREVYSYGRHFPLFRYLPREGRRRALFIINGDASSGGGFWRRSRTPDHQRSAREAIRATGADSVVIPFSALAGAGIDLDSVRLIHARPDAEWTETRTAETLQGVPKWRRVVSYGLEHCAAELEQVPADYRRTWRNGSYCDLEPSADGLYRWNQTHTRDLARDDDGLYRWEVRIHRLGDALFSAVRDGRRARYLSSFDTNESPPLYFLAECPRGCGSTVDSAIDSLAPRAVHAALARGRDVRRQGDVFLIATDLTDLEIELRTVTRARLTQWTRDARARKGEVCFQPKLTLAERRAMTDDARDEWRRIFRPLADSAAARERGAPETSAGARRRWAKLRAEHAAAVVGARRELYGAALGNTRTRGYARYGESPLRARRRNLAESAMRARADLERLLADGPRETRAHGRDDYRRLYGANATGAWARAMQTARARAMPLEHDPDTIGRRRDTVRRALAIYGTAHTASEVVRARNGAVYVRGTVSHVPELERGRGGRPDHARVFLAPGVWYLAVRNTVPRQSRRRARAGAA